MGQLVHAQSEVGISSRSRPSQRERADIRRFGLANPWMREAPHSSSLRAGVPTRRSLDIGRRLAGQLTPTLKRADVYSRPRYIDVDL